MVEDPRFTPYNFVQTQFRHRRIYSLSKRKTKYNLLNWVSRLDRLANTFCFQLREARIGLTSASFLVLIEVSQSSQTAFLGYHLLYKVNAELNICEFCFFFLYLEQICTAFIDVSSYILIVFI